MAVQFILGRSGTGKTSYCIKAIVDALLEPADTQPLILLVPEQATYQAERAILDDKRVAGYSSGTTFCKRSAKWGPRLNVLSFDRLQFLLLGKNTARPALSRIGRQMIIHRILRDNSSKLKVFGSSASWPGLGRQMAETVAELHRYAKTPEDIDRLLGELQKDEHNNLVALKFTDIGLVFKEYLKFIEGRFIDPDIQLNRARQAVAGAALVKGAKLWVDGFAGFTTAELAILAELLKVVSDAQIALCLDPSKIDLTNPDCEKLNPVSLFNPTERTYVALIEIVKKCKLELAEPMVLDTPVRFSACPQLSYIEHNVFELEAPKTLPHLCHSERNEESRHSHGNHSLRCAQGDKSAAADNIRIISAPNARLEVQFVARQILELVKGKSYRYRDIAVIASDIDRYQHYIRAYFGDYGLPFFIDKRKSLNQHPVVQLICSALQAVGGGFSHSDIFAYLKTGLVPIENSDVEPVRNSTKGPKKLSQNTESHRFRGNQTFRCAQGDNWGNISNGIDLLENYCLAFGITGGDWQSDKDWHFAGEDNEDFDEHRINQIRRIVSVPLFELRDKLCPGDNSLKTISAEEFTCVIFDFLDSLGVRERIAGWIEEAIRRRDYTTIDEHRQFYDKLLDIFDELVEVFAGREMTCADFLAIINSAFSQLTLAFIPPTLDQVLVGSIERSRHPDLKAVFLIGATQRQFPVPVGYSGILTDDDRCACESADFTLAATTGQILSERQYLAYIAFTRPSQFLYVTYPLADDKGSSTVRSQFIANLESLFENLSEESIAAEKIDIEKINSENELADLLCSQLGRDSSLGSLLVTRDSLKAYRDRLSVLLDDICSDEELVELGSRVRSAISYDNLAQLDKTIVKKLFGRQIRSSATRLSSFAACPYHYFARYILELKEREEFKFEPLDLGVFYHRLLDALLKRLNAEGKDFAAVQDQELLKILREQISKLVQTDSFISNFARRSAHNTFIITSAGEILEDCVLAIAQMVRAGKFRPTLSEVSFGEVKTCHSERSEGSHRLGEYKIGLAGGRLLFLDGKIDRLDIANVNGAKTAIVFDYKKRRDKSFSWSKFYHGLDMQLPIYMLAVRHTSGSQYKIQDAVGAFYMPVEVSPAKSTIDELSKKTGRFDYKAKGIFNGEFTQQLDGQAAFKDSKFYNFYVTKDGEPYGNYGGRDILKPVDFEKVLRFTEEKVVRLVEEIISGKIDVRPYRLGTESPCSYCKYKSVCRFDWQINDYNFLESVGKLAVLEKIGGC